MKDKTKKALGNALRGGLSFLSGVVGSVNPIAGVVVGAVSGVVNKVKALKDKNLASSVGGVGKVDGAHASGLVVGVGVIVVVILGGVAVAMGWLTMDEVMQLIGIISENVPVETVP